MSSSGAKPVVFSGMQATSVPTLGNYLGAVSRWIDMQRTWDCYFSVVDLHSITVAQDPQKLRDQCYELLAFYLACGLDPASCTLFLQSHVPQHTELAWVLTCFTHLGELNRMHQFKDKSQRLSSQDLGGVGAGLYVYPTLMAADILLYGTHKVPVGEDQKQHVELTRDIALRFNRRFQKEVFVIPDPVIGESGARIMDLQDPEAKMSKSAKNPNGVIFIRDADKDLVKKVKSAVTDSSSEVNPETAGPGVHNLIELYAVLSAKTVTEMEQVLAGKRYGELKGELCELVLATVAPLRKKTEDFLQDKSFLDRTLRLGAEKAIVRAQKTLDLVHSSLGLVSRAKL